MDNVLPLVERVPLLALQFFFTNKEAIPSSVRELESEKTIEQRLWRRADGKRAGTRVIEHTENCSLLSFLSELESTGYRPVDALCQRRVDYKSRNLPFYMVKFVFEHPNSVQCIERLASRREDVLADLTEMCRTALWRTAVYLNPLFDEGERVEDSWTAVIHLDHRQPLFRPSGELVRRWPRDDSGEPLRREGQKAPPIEPEHHLRITDNLVHLSA